MRVNAESAQRRLKNILELRSLHSANVAAQQTVLPSWRNAVSKYCRAATCAKGSETNSLVCLAWKLSVSKDIIANYQQKVS